MAIDGRSVIGMDELITLLADYQVGDRATLTVLRDGETVDIEVTLGARPSSGMEPTSGLGP